MEIFELVFGVFVHLLRVYSKILLLSWLMTLIIVGLAILYFSFKKDSHKVAVLSVVLVGLFFLTIVASLFLLF